jgi:tetratricopeptide (TPR) repeat protein
VRDAPKAPPRWQEEGSDAPLGGVLRKLPAPRPAVGARERVWRRIAAKPRSPFRLSWAAALAGAAFAAVFLAFVQAPSGAPIARVSAASGVEALRFDDAVALLSGGAVASARHQGWRNQAIEIDLESGRVVVADEPRPAERALSVVAGGYTVKVLGTVFSVEKSLEGVEVRVQEGRVQVTGPHTDVKLKAGDSWSSAAGAAYLPIEAGEARQAVSLLRGARVVDASAPSVPAPAPVVAALSPAPVKELSAARGAAVGGIPALSSYERGKNLAARGEYAAAAASFQEAGRGSGPRAELALYEVGRLQLRNLGEPAAAAETFRRTRARFPDGQLRAEVDLSLIESLLDARSFEDAGEAMDGFMRRYPQSERRSEVLRLRADLRRQQGNWRGALEDYAALLEKGPSDDALYFSAFCWQRLGDSRAARALLERYVKDFPNGRHSEDAKRAIFF